MVFYTFEWCKPQFKHHAFLVAYTLHTLTHTSSKCSFSHAFERKRKLKASRTHNAKKLCSQFFLHEGDRHKASPLQWNCSDWSELNRTVNDGIHSSTCDSIVFNEFSQTVAVCCYWNWLEVSFMHSIVVPRGQLPPSEIQFTIIYALALDDLFTRNRCCIDDAEYAIV